MVGRREVRGQRRRQTDGPSPDDAHDEWRRTMRSPRIWKLVVTLVAIAMLAGSATSHAGKANSRKYAPHIDPAEFGTRVDHPYFPLVPGTRFVYSETDRGKTLVNEVSVLASTKVIMGVTCTVVHDVLKTGDTVKEDTFDWY